MNLNEFYDLNDYMNILNNLCIYIVYFYSIILILDELYNIGIFTFNYTYNYNYGTATQNFNNINTIEYETNRFKTYSNINFLKSDIFNNTYFNYLITIFITLITIISCISYGIFFYYKIINTSSSCKYDQINDELMSLPKKFLKCICNDCHKILPNCSINYLILLIIIIIIPFTYIIKLFLKYDYTPTSNSTLLILLIVLFSYIYNIYINNDNKDTLSIIKEILIFIFFTIIFIISIIIHKNIYDTYNNSSLNNNLKDDYIMYDIYKQSPPNKPSPIPLPIFNGENLLNTFKFVDGGDDNDVNYNNKKQLLEKYYSDKKDYEKTIKEYNIKNDSFNSILKNQKLKLNEKVYFFDIMFNILGINNKFNIIIIILILLLLGLYYYFNDELFLSGMIYLINVLILITLINAITYYNTYLNKYIIYEPCAYYKNDLTISNTKLNIYMSDENNGFNFYNILNNNSGLNNNINDNISKNNIINDIKSLTNISNFNFDNIKLIISNINDYNKLNTNPINKNKNEEIDSIVYYQIPNKTPIEYLFNEIDSIYIINNNIDDFKIINSFILNFSSKTYELNYDLSSYYAYIYYNLYLYKIFFLNLFEKQTTQSIDDIQLFKELYLKIDKIINLLEIYKTNIIYYNDDDKRIEFINENDFKNNLIEEAIKKSFNSISIVQYLAASKLQEINNIYNNITYNEILNDIKELLFNLNINSNILNFNYSFFKNFSISNPYIINVRLTNVNDKLSITAGAYILINIYGKKLLLKPANILKTKKEQPYIIQENIKYYEFPNKISDNNNNNNIIFKMKSLTLLNSIDNIYFIFNKNVKINKNYKFLSIKNVTDNNINITFSSETKNTLKAVKTDVQTTITSQLYIPSKMYLFNSAPLSDVLKKIINDVLYNNIANITSRFYKLELQNKFNTGENLLPDINFNNYLSLFNFPYKNTDTGFIKNFNINNNTNIAGFLILLYNIYNSNIDKIPLIIEYLIYTIKIVDVSSFTYTLISTLSSDSNLIKDLDTLETKINKPKEETDKTSLAIYYEKNKYLVNVILNIYSNIFNNIKSVISTIDKQNLCFSSTDKGIIETNLLNHIKMYYNITTEPITSSSIIVFNEKMLYTNDKNKINDINQSLLNIFKIIDFLFDNLSSDIQLISSEKDEIIKNYNFYNPELYNNIKDFVKEELIINCDYINKYNNLESNKLDYFKYNSDNVAYNFPILLIIFIVIFGEGFFIKS